MMKDVDDFRGFTLGGDNSAKDRAGKIRRVFAKENVTGKELSWERLAFSWSVSRPTVLRGSAANLIPNDSPETSVQLSPIDSLEATKPKMSPKQLFLNNRDVS